MARTIGWVDPEAVKVKKVAEPETAPVAEEKPKKTTTRKSVKK